MLILETIVPVFLMIALGKLLTVKGLLTENGIACIKNLSVNVFLPVMAFDALIHGTYSKDSVVLILLEFFALFAAFFAGFLFKRLFDKSLQDYIPYAMTTYEGGLFGWALIAILVGQENLYYIVSMDIFSGVFGFTVMATGFKMINGEKLSRKDIFLSIIKNPLIISVVLGFAGAAIGLGNIIDNSAFASFYEKTTGMFTKPLSSMILISIGAGLVFDKNVLAKGIKFVSLRYAVQAAICAIVLAAIYFSIGLSKVLLVTLLMYFCCPASFLISMYSQKKEAIEFTSAVLSLQIIVALFAFSVIAVFAV